ncbi:MAG: 4Fe-4S binding protein [Dysgonamonadaceae bacterium]|nr:4Fe-4S binding protein [Dysgonamonadaceae bacterium]
MLRIQFIPAILSGSILIIAGLILITVLFGRIYCSVLCPLGILQDIIARFAKIGKKNKKKRRYHYASPYSILRYTLLIICVIFLIFGESSFLLLLDPYSNFGRIAVNIFRPVVTGINNLVNMIALKFSFYNFYHITIHTITIFSFVSALIVLLIIGFMSVMRGRLFCNSICPVGSLLGLLSKFAVFKIILDDSKCSSCGLCEKSCKSQCINSKEKKVDFTRCVNCFNCLNKCKTNGIKYKFAYSSSYKAPYPVNEDSLKKGIDRRSFIVTSAAIASTIPLVPAWAQTEKKDSDKITPITPPGSISLKHFKEHCTACHLCVTHCPMQILKPSGFSFGIDYAFKPRLVFYEMAFCNFECTVCSEICPTGAIKKLTKDQKKVTQIGIAQFTKDRCVVFKDNTSCGACSEHCPVQAVKMEPYKDGLTIPHVYEELCVGCGGCESICPVRPLKAINVKANEVHKEAVRQKEEDAPEINQEELNFGF